MHHGRQMYEGLLFNQNVVLKITDKNTKHHSKELKTALKVEKIICCCKQQKRFYLKYVLMTFF